MTPESLKIQFSEILNQPVDQIKKLSGGCSFPAFVVTSGTEKYFVKTNLTRTDVFQKEASGLKQIRSHSDMAPEVMYFDETHLVLQYIEPESTGKDFWQSLACGLAELHKRQGKSFGFFEDNWIGKAAQLNVCEPAISWSDFFWQYRLFYKMEQINENAPGTFSTQQLDRLQKASSDILGSHRCHPSPLHGDLWNGNIVCGKDQKAFLIDPAFYFGDRETDLAMTECFGGFPPEFYQAYNQAYPLNDGYDVRKHLYNLYHMLNHQLIFGGQYGSAVQGLMTQLGC